jgi:hypothetical protein
MAHEMFLTREIFVLVECGARSRSKISTKTYQNGQSDREILYQAAAICKAPAADVLPMKEKSATQTNGRLPSNPPDLVFFYATSPHRRSGPDCVAGIHFSEPAALTITPATPSRL